MNILIVGLGSIGRKHVMALHSIDPAYNIFALRSAPDADTVDGVHNIHSLDELTVPVSFAIIANTTSAHESTINSLLALNCPLFIEKPVLSHTDGADCLLEKIRQAGVLTYVACNLRFHPALENLKTIIQEQRPRINEVNIYCGSYLPDWRPGKNFRAGYSANKEMGGGVHLDLIHELDYCSWLFGFPETTHAFQYSLSSLHINAVDSAFYHCRYATFSCNIALNYYRRDTKRTIEIVGEAYTLLADILANRITDLTNNKVLFAGESFDFFHTYIDQMRYFISHVERQKPMANDFENAVKVLKIAINE